MIKCDKNICEYPDCGKTCGMSELELIKYLQQQVRDAHVDLHWAESALYSVRAQVARVHHEIKNLLPDYEPVCPCGCSDCVLDPAYIRWSHPEWWKKLGMPTECDCWEKDEDGNICCNHYDDEDK